MDSNRIWRIVGLYAVLATGWVLGSDWLMLQLVAPEALADASMLKGAGFVLVTSVILFIILHRLSSSERRAHSAEAGNRTLTRRVPQFFSSIPVVVYALERDGANFHPVWVSDNLQSTFGYTLDEALAPGWWHEHVHPDDIEAVVDALGKVVDLGSVVHEYRFLRADGRVAYIHDELRYIDATATEPAQIVGAWTDISARVAIEEALRNSIARTDRTLAATVDVVSHMVEVRDPYTAGHEHRVGEIAAAIAQVMGHDDHMLRGLRIAGSLHDVGKIQVPSEILTKPSRLSAIEFSLVKEHAQAGYEILKGVEFPWPVAEVARQHHERIDGSGYPRGLKGDEILLEARIIAIADVVESMASHRPYRAGLGIDAALAEIERGAGTLYDLAAAAACLKLFRDDGYTLPT
ncbi:MAG: HD domain-containing phosphohydrolase [Gammaproteobacteria bacterium]